MNQQRGYGLGGVFRSAGRYVNPILEEVGKITATVGADLAKNLLTDAIEGKDVKESARERGKEAGKQSLNLGTKRVIQKIQGPKVSPKAKAAPKAVKRPRSQSGGPKKKKPKKSQKGGKRKRKNALSQKGGFTRWLLEKHARKQRGGRKQKKSQKKAVGVVFPRAMTSKQRRSLPAKDIFG